ncbi:uncharacterized protein A4U43_C08F26350 [Asparagus officinalis]|uniref:probable proteasome inhibitor isoform X2 n=1 Tax=Asparagus officinalis TaxID=4686 RepID=UPI00098E1C81|nr:probable proteasome inhibitor isoform X2 [Asparagus officinalis]ONK61110.1 uncharacterized protein A4U43_C08F26350 [Asparagus officinalis]
MATDNSVMAVIRASRPNFRNPSDRMAFAVHASFLAAGYSLISTGPSAFSENPPTGDEVGIEGWNEFEDSYAFVYLKSDKGQKIPILVKCLAIGDALVVDVLNLREDKKEPFHVQINMNEHLVEGDNKVNYGEMYKNLPRLVENLNANILNKVESKTESSSAGSSGNGSGDNTRREPVHMFPVERQQPPPVLRYPPVPASGGSDLFPGPGAGVFPDRGTGSGGSMLVGPNDPRFFSPGGGPGFDFPGSDLLPPGARYDPIGPPNVPGFHPERFVRNPPQGPGRGGGVHPDLQHFPGSDDFI